MTIQIGLYTIEIAAEEENNLAQKVQKWLKNNHIRSKIIYEIDNKKKKKGAK